MNIRDFEYIIKVDELKSFIEASKKCFVSQPALSMQIQKVENILGVKIFERTKRSIITTNEGKKVVEYAKDILKNFEDIKNLKNNAQELKIGIIPTISPYLLSSIITKLEEEFKNIKLFFIEEKTKILDKMLNEGEIDMAILALNGKYNSNFIAEKLYDEEFFICLPNKKFDIKNTRITEEELNNVIKIEKIILLEEGNCMADNVNEICSSYQNIAEFFKHNGTRTDFYATSIETIKYMIKLNNGVSILPKLSIINETNISSFQMPKSNFRSIYSIYRKNNLKMNVLKKINNIISSNFINLYKLKTEFSKNFKKIV